MRIAIIILLHEYNEQQKQLINHLSKDFDVYVHVDKRSKININEIKSTNVFVFSEYKIYWGDFSLVLATIFLFRKAFEHKHKRYIVISGADIPLKSNSEIYDFFESNRNEYFSYFELPDSRWKGNGGFDRFDYYWPKLYVRGASNIFQCLISKISNKIIDSFIIPFLSKLKIHRKRIKNIKYYGGTNWMDLTDNCVSQILSLIDTNKCIIKKFKHTRCCDEVFFQTIILNYVKNINIENTVLRYIDWETGPEYPRTLRMEDYSKLKKSNKIFARKFNSSVDNEIIKKIYLNNDLSLFNHK